MNVQECVLHYMTPATAKEPGVTTGKASVSEGSVKMPPSMRASLEGRPGGKWKNACGKPFKDSERDGCTLLVKVGRNIVVNCPECLASEAFKAALANV